MYNATCSCKNISIWSTELNFASIEGSRCEIMEMQEILDKEGEYYVKCLVRTLSFPLIIVCNNLQF